MYTITSYFIHPFRLLDLGSFYCNLKCTVFNEKLNLNTVAVAAHKNKWILQPNRQ